MLILFSLMSEMWIRYAIRLARDDLLGFAPFNQRPSDSRWQGDNILLAQSVRPSKTGEGRDVL